MARSNRRSGRTSRNSHRNILGNTNRTKSAPRKSTFLFGAVALVSIAIVVLVGAWTRYVSPPQKYHAVTLIARHEMYQYVWHCLYMILFRSSYHTIRLNAPPQTHASELNLGGER